MKNYVESDQFQYNKLYKLQINSNKFINSFSSLHFWNFWSFK